MIEDGDALADRVLISMCIGLKTGGPAMSMTCKATIRLICEYLEGRLAPEVASEIQRHLGCCKNCRAVFDAASLTLEVYFDREVETADTQKSRVA
jgi:Putative zinc-finger